MSETRPIRLMVHGARGKMGAQVAALARRDARFELVATCDLDDHEQADRMQRGSIDALIDFSSDQGAAHAARLAINLRCALLVGTTGLSQNSLDSIEDSARSVPVMVAANTSLGVAVLNHLAAQAARLLGSEFSVDLMEAHHAAKRDAPSGTALRLAQSLRDQGGVNVPRERIHSIRAGDIIGEHSVQFAGLGEILELTHRATSRELFARGALRAVAWLVHQGPGRYSIEQGLGIRD